MLGAVAAVRTLRVNEVYDRATVQGEGPHAGRLCTFVRLYGCNLTCRWCDTAYTWDVNGLNGVRYPRAENQYELPVERIVERVVALGVPICVVSGGEPLLQAKGVYALAAQLATFHVETHVETNGTREPATETVIAHYSVSPKLASAQAGSPERVQRLDVLALWAKHPRAVFKIVCNSRAEVREAVRLMDAVRVPPERRWVMPEGKFAHELAVTLPVVADAAVEQRINLSPRLHVEAWGNERGR